jgi:hypothetical protein
LGVEAHTTIKGGLISTDSGPRAKLFRSSGSNRDGGGRSVRGSGIPAIDSPQPHTQKKGEKNAPPSELLQTTPRTEHTKVKHMSKVQKSSHNEKDNCSKPPLSRKGFPSHLKLSAQSNFPLVFSACTASIHESPRMYNGSSKCLS